MASPRPPSIPQDRHSRLPELRGLQAAELAHCPEGISSGTAPVVVLLLRVQGAEKRQACSCWQSAIGCTSFRAAATDSRCWGHQQSATQLLVTGTGRVGLREQQRGERPAAAAALVVRQLQQRIGVAAFDSQAEHGGAGLRADPIAPSAHSNRRLGCRGVRHRSGAHHHPVASRYWLECCARSS
jgi:hypothetical protein